jgi:hypothetical protein
VIGKDLAVWLEKFFEAKIPANTMRVRADRMKERLCTNVHSPSTNGNNSEIQEKPVETGMIVRGDNGRFAKGTKMAGPGRGAKFQPGPKQYAAESMQFATMAIAYLESIRIDDPYGMDALRKVARGKVDSSVVAMI